MAITKKLIAKKTTAKRSNLPGHAEVSFDVVKALHATPFDGQRSHKLHLNEAKYLKARCALHGDQLVFHAVRYYVMKGSRRVLVTKLVDGYTRIEAVLQQLMEAPETVLLLTHTVEDYEAAYAIYCQFNSPAASKRGKHQVQGGVREASSTTPGAKPRDSFDTGLMLRGPLTSGIQYSGLSGGDLRAKTSNGYATLCALDSMGLSKNGETTGLMSAYIAILNRDLPSRAEHAMKFIQLVNYAGNLIAPKAAVQHAEAARDFHNRRRTLKTTSGQRNVCEIRDTILAYYMRYLSVTLRRPKMAPRVGLTLGEFKDAA